MGFPTVSQKNDVVSEIAKAIFENNPELIYRAYVKAVAKGNAYGFKELTDRAYGKLKETHAVEVDPYRGVSDEELVARMHQLEGHLGFTKVLPSADEAEVLPPADLDSKPN